MRKLDQAAMRREVRDLVDRCEGELEVTELEVVLSQLAYLMSLSIEESDGVRAALKEVLGVQASRFGDLSDEQVQSLEVLAETWTLPPKPRIVFWMWRAWLMQKDFDGLSKAEARREIQRGIEADEKEIAELEAMILDEPDPARRELLESHVALRKNALEEQRALLESLPELSTPTMARTSLEWMELGPDALEARHELEAVFEQLADKLLYAVEGARYAHEAFGGSPMATLRASRLLLGEALGAVRAAEKSVGEAYGFGTAGRPNKRFPRKATRNIRAYFCWKRQPFDDDILEEFPPGHLRTEGARRKAKNALDKEASRMDARIRGDWLGLLKSAEEAGSMPKVFYAKRLRAALNGTEQRP